MRPELKSQRKNRVNPKKVEKLIKIRGNISETENKQQRGSAETKYSSLKRLMKQTNNKKGTQKHS